MVTFERHNLVDPVPHPVGQGDTDLILCRNVLLYFDAATARAVAGRLAACLHQQGWLLLSPVEAATLGGLDGCVIDPRWGGAYRRTPPAPAPVPAPARRPPAREAPVRPVAAAPPATPPSPAVPPPPLAADGVPPGYDEALRLWREDRPRAALRRLRVEGAGDQLTAPLHYLEGLILLDRGRAEAALAAFRRCTFADPGFALGHLAQAGLFTQAGSQRRALAALESAARLVAHLDREARVFQGDELRAGALLDLVEAQRRRLGTPAGEETVDA
jgi:chemotaxis protein methyltransferase CheR